jgi:hypothetical protein
VQRVLNGIDLADAATPSPANEVPKLVFVGRFNPQKCPDFLIDVLAALSNQRWHATLIGDGPVMPLVRSKIEQHRLGERVTLTGWLDGASVERTLRESDIFLMPSTSEGLPVAAIEALKQGLAIVASEFPACWIRSPTARMVYFSPSVISLTGVKRWADCSMTAPGSPASNKRASKSPTTSIFDTLQISMKLFSARGGWERLIRERLPQQRASVKYPNYDVPLERPETHLASRAHSTRLLCPFPGLSDWRRSESKPVK